MTTADSAAGAGETGATIENEAAQTQTDQESLAAILEPHELAALKLEETNDEHKKEVEGEEHAGDGSGAEGDRASEDASAGESAGTEEGVNEDAEAKGEAAGAEDEDEQDGADPKKPNPFDDDRVQKRLSREARKRDRLLKAAGITDEQLAEVHKAEDPIAAAEALLTKRATVQPVQVAPSAADPLADVTDAAGLQDKAAFYKDLQRFATLNPDGATDVVVGTDAEGREILRDYSKQDIAKMKLEAEEALRDWIPERQKYLAQEQKADKWVREFTLPSMFKEGSEHNQKFQNLLKQFPEAVRVPEYKLTIAHIILGQEVEKLMLENARKEQAAAGGKNGSGKSKVKPEVEPFLRKHPAKAPGVAGVRGQGGDGAGKTAAKPQDVEKARQRVEQGGGEDAEIEFISALSASQQKQKGAALV